MELREMMLFDVETVDKLEPEDWNIVNLRNGRYMYDLSPNIRNK